MLINDVMTRYPAYSRPDDNLETVAKLMLERDCGIIPVCQGRKVVGVITDRDITCRSVAAGRIPTDVPVSELMTSPVYCVHDHDDVQAAVDLMEEKQVRRLPVLDENDDLVGIVAPSDLAPMFASTNVADFLLAVSYWTRKPAAPAV
jgi:CBS domain-containing protein